MLGSLLPSLDRAGSPDRFLCATRRPQRLCLSLLVAAALLFSCTKVKKPTPHADAPAELASTSATGSGPAADDPIADALGHIARQCHFNEEHGLITSCAQHQHRVLVRDIRNGKHNRVAALKPLLSALQSDDPRLQIAAARVAHGSLRQGLGAVAPGAITAAEANAWLTALRGLPSVLANAIVATTVHVTLAAGQDEALYQLLDKHPDMQLRATGYGQLAAHGGLRILPKLKELLQSDEPALAAAAIHNGSQLPAGDRPPGGEVCQLGQQYLGDRRPLVALRAGEIAANCGPPGVDALLADVAARQKARNLHMGYARAVAGLCGAGRARASAQQCQRLRALLIEIAADKKHDDPLRASALMQLGIQFPEPATRQVIEGYTKDPSTKLSSYADRALRRLAKESRQAASASPK